ncbi:ABC transporter C family member 3-like [Rhodamnia argentea]|uniref:ABC-type xenobiotic transporter n=1 Tax=Rhodamnia argentea TaxID=178133 RepID=A0A8B8MX02_9MYRT|nr:ABC transporter C family member 3-like [Rhodamnia argentea]
MELFDSPKQFLENSLSHSSTLMYSGGSFLLKTTFLRSFSGSLHLILLLGFLISRACKNSWARHVEGPKGSPGRSKLWYYKPTLICCLGVSVFSLVLCVTNYFYWYRNDWSEEKLVFLLDLGLKTLAWGALSVYLYGQSSTFGGSNFPLLLRVWWGFYLSISCYCLVMDIVLSAKHASVQTRYIISDIVTVIAGLFCCYVGFFGKIEIDDNLLEESLLHGDSVTVGAEFNKRRGGGTVTPYSKAGLFNIITFSWLSPLIALGNKKALDLEDIPQLYSRDSLVGTLPDFKKRLESAVNSSNGMTSFGLAKALILSEWKEIIYTAVLALLHTPASYVGPYLIDDFVQYLNGQHDFNSKGYLLVLAFSVAKLVECLCYRQLMFRLQLVGIRTRSLLVAIIYDKGLTLSCQSKQDHTSGEIINFMAVDAERIGEFSWSMHVPWLVLLQVGLALAILYKDLGLAAIAAFVATVLVMLANVPLGSFLEKFQDKLMESKDKRMKATSEILRNMRILKLQAWEMKFLSKIIELRNVEAGWLKKFVYAQALTSFVFYGAPTFVSVATFGACLLLGIPLSSGRVLSAIATVRILQGPIYSLPDVMSMIAQTKVSLDRLSSFLRLEDLQNNVVEKLPQGTTDVAIEITAGNFTWDLSSPDPTLKDINLKVRNGMKVAVCGIVGSGKSSLLSCILGELAKISGTIRLCGTKAYVAQSPWIQSGKIEENILFGKKMDRERYERIIEACCLKKDLEILPFGDQTIIGERGINMSGGQKQRVQIARAIYQDADVYLLDDPFSAVDAHTGSHIFKECLLGLLSSKTVIYITHQVEFLPMADLILVMRDGKIMEAGKYGDILHSGADFRELVGAHKKALSGLASTQNRPDSLGPTVSIENGETESSIETDENSNLQDGMVGPRGQLVQEEEREKGRVGFPVYWKFITTAYGGGLVPFILLAQILFQLLQIGSNYWLAWATPVSEDIKPAVAGLTLILVYVVLVVGGAFCVLARSSLLATAGYKTATILFNKLHLAIFRAPMSFFDATPSGRILNRVSTDQSTVDMSIQYRVAASAFSMIQLLGVIAVMSQVAWQVFIIFIPVVAACVWYQQYYLPSARELARLVGVCKAPVIQHFSETVSGSTTIRGFDQESRFRDTNMELSDVYSRPKFHGAGAMEWLCFRLDMLSSFTFGFSLIFLISLPERFIDPAIAGLAVTYGLNLNAILAWVIWNLCNMENKIISVERILQYSCISSEPALVIDNNRPHPSWPSSGEIGISDLQVQYAPHLPLVLRGITCTFPGGMRTGIVGRTGSGKSTLIQTLFRVVEPCAGQILIDGVNISSIGLHDLRSRLSIIPQDPTMFEGTVRSNLDPLEEYTEDQIWEALDKCQLGDKVRKKEGKLDSPVAENGENWSMGQRQLVCLGRVLLKKSKILVLDEATASVDTATDNLIQQTLRHHFSDCTVITIAHRITSVLDSAVILLLDHGLVAEYDSPKRLLDKESSVFAQLVAEYMTRSSPVSAAKTM